MGHKKYRNYSHKITIPISTKGAIAMSKKIIIVLSCLGLLACITVNASAQTNNRLKSKKEIEQLRRQIDSLSKTLEDLENDESALFDTTGFGELFGGLGNLDLLPQLDFENIPSPLLPYLHPKVPNHLPPMPLLPYFENPEPQPLPQEPNGTPIPGFPKWHIKFLKDICRQL